MQKVITTILGRRKLALARKGEKQLPAIKGIVLGDGAILNGELIELTEADTSLRNEIYRKDYDKCEKVNEFCYRYSVILEKDDLVGKNITEAGLFDIEGDLIMIKIFDIKKKDDDMVMIFEIDDKF